MGISFNFRVSFHNSIQKFVILVIGSIISPQCAILPEGKLKKIKKSSDLFSKSRLLTANH